MRVHEEILKRQQLPPRLVSKRIWDERLADIAHFEDYLTRQGTIVLKFFLNVSREEQKKRFMQRLERPEKNWKFSASDVHERKFWDDYMHAFEEAIRATASKHAPWYVVPADNKWFTRLVVAAAIVEAVEELEPHLSEGRRGEEEGVGGRACGACRPDLIRRRRTAEAWRNGSRPAQSVFREAESSMRSSRGAAVLRTTTKIPLKSRRKGSSCRQRSRSSAASVCSCSA